MQIDRKTLDEFKRLYEEEFKEKIDDKEAFDRFSRLVNVLRIVYYPESTEQNSSLILDKIISKRFN